MSDVIWLMIVISIWGIAFTIGDINKQNILKRIERVLEEK